MPWKDLRKGRFSNSGSIYFITFVVHERIKIFDDFCLASLFCRNISINELSNNSTWLSWVLMPDHFHGLLQLGDEAKLSHVIRQLKSKTAVEINRTLNRRGQVWQHAYYDHCIRKEEDLLDICRYIVANPLRAQLVDEIGKYSFWDSKYL